MFATILVSVLACTQMENPGNPFSPVQIAEEKAEGKSESVRVSEEKTEETKQEVDPLFEPKGAVLVVSEIDEQPAVRDLVNSPQEEQLENDLSKESVDETQPKEEATVEPEVLVDVENQDEQKVNTEKKEADSLGEWPLRLVKTEVDLNPPRAILGLPSGEEVVIRPGMQLPEENLVVMSIGAKAVVLARIHTNGDHARVEHLTLPSLND